MALVDLLKLSSRFPCSKRIAEIIVQLKGNLELELQQRAIEFNLVIVKHENIRLTLVERMMLVLDEATFICRSAGSLPGATSTTTAPSVNLLNGVAKLAAPLVDLLDLSSVDVPVPSSSGSDFLKDLLGVDLSSASQHSGWCL